MEYKVIDMDSYKRKKHFEHFNSLAFPYVAVTKEVDITKFQNTVKERNLPFFISFCYLIAKAANGVPEFRQRILDGKIIEYDRCRPSYTVALEDETYCYCTLDTDKPLAEFIPYAMEEQKRAQELREVEDGEDFLSLFLISTIPWMDFCSLMQPAPIPADSNPRIVWGKYQEQDGKQKMPVAVQCNHALVDGLHLAKFYGLLETYLNDFETM